MEFEILLFNKLYAFAFQSGITDFFIIFFARYLAYVLIATALIILFLERNWRVRAYNISLTVLTFILSRGLIVELIRFFYQRTRPPITLSIESLITLPNSASFPSGHATVFFALGTAFYFLHRGWGITFLVLATCMGVARVMTGVHWPLDILGGALIGIVSGIIVQKLLSRFQVLS